MKINRIFLVFKKLGKTEIFDVLLPPDVTAVLLSSSEKILPFSKWLTKKNNLGKEVEA